MGEFEYEVDKYWFKFSNFFYLCLSLFCFWYAIDGVDKGSIKSRTVEASRIDDPVLFWIYFFMVVAAGLLFLYKGIKPFILSKKLPNKKINKDT